MVDLSVIIVSWNTRKLLHDCLASLDEHLAAVSHEVIVVDNGSTDGSPEMVERDFPAVRIVRNTQNTGFGIANNQAMRVAQGRWFLLLNSDTYLTDDSVAALFERVRNESSIGVAQCRLFFPDGRLQYTTRRFATLGLTVFESMGLYKLTPRRTPDILLGGYWPHDDERDVDWVIGAFMLLQRSVFEQTGGFDESLFMYGEDREWCYRIRQRGWRIRFYPQASIVHVGHASADIGLGAERLTMCLSEDLRFLVARIGYVRSRLALAVLILGAALRVFYYALRVARGGASARAYRAMQPEVEASLRILVGIALGRDPR